MLIEKNNSTSFIYGQSSTNPANVVKISLVVVEIVGLAEVTKILKNKTSAKHKPSSLVLRALRVG